HRMTERCGAYERDRLTGAAATAGERTATATRNRRLRQAVLDLLEEGSMRGPFRVPQPWRCVHRRRHPEPLEFGPEWVVIGMVEIAVFNEHRPNENGAD